MSSLVSIDFDDILKEIAKALHKNEDIDNLGKALGFGPADIGRATEENIKQGGKYMGTFELLRTWQKRQTPSTEKAALKEALLRAGLKKQADQYLSTPVTVDNSALLQSSTVTQGVSLNSLDQFVTEKQLRKLAGLLSAENCKDVVTNLGVSYIEQENSRMQNQASIKDANSEMLMRWKLKNGGMVSDLDKALKDADCEGISYKD